MQLKLTPQLHRSYRRSADSFKTQMNGTHKRLLEPVPVALLPPIPLYRRLLRAHRHKLLPEERVLGDEYLKSEFRSHRNVENPIHLIGFLTEWQLYAQKLEGDNWRDDRMNESKVERLSDEQTAQLYQLMEAIQKRSVGNGNRSKGD